MKLEDFVNHNREAFDDKSPSDKVWRGVSSQLPGKQIQFWNSLTLWRAAAAVFFAVSVYLLIPKFTTSSNSQHHDVAMNEFNDIEKFYVEQISEKVELIDQFQKAEGLNGFTQDFKQLEAMYAVLKEEMKNHPSQKVKDALVLNLLVRIDLLNQELHKLEQKNSDSKDQSTSATSV